MKTDMDRRDFLGTSSRGAASLALTSLLAGASGGALGSAVACGAKDLLPFVNMLVDGFSQIESLLPELGLSQAAIEKIEAWLSKGRTLANDFDVAYRAGKFTDAITVFANLGPIIQSIADEFRATDNRLVKIALATIGIGNVAILAWLKKQHDESGAVQAAVATETKRNPAMATAVQTMQGQAQIVDIDAVVKALFP